jgi:hypothetical protein
MKKSILILFLFNLLSVYGQKAQFNLFTSVDVPNKTSMTSMQNVFSLGVGFGYRPMFGVPVLLELKGSLGRYASESEKYKYNLYENHSSTTVRFNYSSELNKFLLGAKWLIRHDFRTLRFYATPQIGFVSLKTLNSYTFQDPNDNDISDNFTSHRSVHSVYGGELGMEIILNDIFKMKKKNTHRVQMSFTFLRSFKPVHYSNVNELISEYSLTEDQLSSGKYFPMKNDYFYDDYMLELHKAKLSMWGINVGYIYTIDWKEK